MSVAVYSVSKTKLISDQRSACCWFFFCRFSFYILLFFFTHFFHASYSSSGSLLHKLSLTLHARQKKLISQEIYVVLFEANNSKLSIESKSNEIKNAMKKKKTKRFFFSMCCYCRCTGSSAFVLLKCVIRCTKSIRRNHTAYGSYHNVLEFDPVCC